MLAVTTDGFPPYRCTCGECGASWTPTPAKGKTTPSQGRIEKEIAQHWATCPDHQREQVTPT